MKVLLADYEGFRRDINLDTNNKKAIKKFCNGFICLWEKRKEQNNCNQDIANGQIKAYEFIRDVLTSKKKRKYGTLKNKRYWINKIEKKKLCK